MLPRRRLSGTDGTKCIASLFRMRWIFLYALHAINRCKYLEYVCPTFHRNCHLIGSETLYCSRINKFRVCYFWKQGTSWKLKIIEFDSSFPCCRHAILFLEGIKIGGFIFGWSSRFVRERFYYTVCLPA